MCAYVLAKCGLIFNKKILCSTSEIAFSIGQLVFFLVKLIYSINIVVLQHLMAVVHYDESVHVFQAFFFFLMSVL